MAVITPCHRYLTCAVGCKATGSTTIGIDDVHVKAALTVAGEGNLRAIRTPNGLEVMCRIGSQLARLASLGINAEDITLVTEGYLLAIGRDGRIAHPQGILLCDSTCCRKQHNRQYILSHRNIIILSLYFSNNWARLLSSPTIQIMSPFSNLRSGDICERFSSPSSMPTTIQL